MLWVWMFLTCIDAFRLEKPTVVVLQYWSTLDVKEAEPLLCCLLPLLLKWNGCRKEWAAWDGCLGITPQAAECSSLWGASHLCNGKTFTSCSVSCVPRWNREMRNESCSAIRKSSFSYSNVNIYIQVCMYFSCWYFYYVLHLKKKKTRVSESPFWLGKL